MIARLKRERAKAPIERVVLWHALLGVLLGASLPLAAGIWALAERRLPLSRANLVSMLEEQPLLWITLAVPLLVGACACLAGIRLAEAGRLKEALAARLRERDQAAGQLEALKAGLHRLDGKVAGLLAAARVGREIAAIRATRPLLERAVELVSRHFGVYHAGIFLLDANGEYAILQAASSPGGRRLLSQGFRQDLRQAGIVAHAATCGEPRIALDVGLDAVVFDNPELAETRSQAVLPLKDHQRVIGVLDVQSEQPAAFGEEDLEVLQLLAEQLSLAIENARLFQESQQALQELETIYGRQASQAWRRRIQRRWAAYRYSDLGVEPARAGEPRDAEAQAGELSVSIALRGASLGSIRLRRDSQQEAWLPQERALAEEAAARIALALENARLLEETRLRAERERLVTEITTRMRASNDPNVILQTALEELHQALEARQARVSRGVESTAFVSSRGAGDGGRPGR